MLVVTELRLLGDVPALLGMYLAQVPAVERANLQISVIVLVQLGDSFRSLLVRVSPQLNVSKSCAGIGVVFVSSQQPLIDLDCLVCQTPGFVTASQVETDG